MKSDLTSAQLNESAMEYFAKGDSASSLNQLQDALLLNPDYHEAWYNRAVVLLTIGKVFDAMVCCSHALAAAPKAAAYYGLLGVCHMQLNRLQQADDLYDKAIEIDPNLASVWVNKGMVHRLGGFLQDAVEYHSKAIELDPNNSDYRMRLGLACLQAGDLKRGWIEYEKRIYGANTPVRILSLPEWRGQRDGGVVLYSEQGFGDVIQFVRFAPIIKEMYGISVWIEVKKPLLSLCRTLRRIDGVIAYGDDMPKDASYCLSVINSPRWCECNTFDDIPTEPYLGETC